MKIKNPINMLFKKRNNLFVGAKVGQVVVKIGWKNLYSTLT